MYINFNGKIVLESEACISPSNRSFRFADGCFETMRIAGGEIVLKHLHLQRLFYSLDQLQFRLPLHFTPAYITNCIQGIVKQNQHQNARVRLTIYRSDGGLYDPADHYPNFIIQVYPLDAAKPAINHEGLSVDIFRDSIKAADQFSSIKTNNFLPYVMAALWATKNKLNDAFLLNQFGNLADSTIANVFIVENGTIKTPALQQGAIDGIMRRHLLQSLYKDDMPVQECAITIDDVLNASEVFLTNAIRGIQWVKQVAASNYTNQLSAELYHKYILPLYP